MERNGGVAAIVCDTVTGNTERHGVLLHLSRDSGGISVGSLRG